MAEDVPGLNDTGAVVHDEPLFADKEVCFHGQLVALVVGETAEICREAAAKVVVEYEKQKPILSVSPIDCEALDLLFGFDFAFRGNHNALLAEALGVGPALDRAVEIPGTKVINYEPSLTLAVDEDCRIQVRVSTEARTNAFQVRTGDFAEEQLSVYVTARQYGSLDAGMTFVDAIERLYGLARDVVDGCVVDQILRPLARTISLK